MPSKDVIVDVDIAVGAPDHKFMFLFSYPSHATNFFLTYFCRIVSAQVEISSGRYAYLVTYLLNQCSKFLLEKFIVFS